MEDSKSRRNQSTIHQESKDNVDDGTAEESPSTKIKKKATCLTPDLDAGEKFRGSTPGDGMRTTMTAKMARKNNRDIMRGTLPTNKQPLYCRVVENENP